MIALDANFDAAAGLENDPIFAFEAFPTVKSTFLSATNLIRARATLARLKPDLLLTYNWGAVEWALANRVCELCRHIHLESGFGPDESPDRQRWRRQTARRFLLAKCDKVVVPSLVLHNVATGVWQLPAAKVRYLPNGIDCHRFDTGPDRELLGRLGIPNTVLVVGAVAALRKEKNLPRLLRIFATLPRNVDARLLIVGDGPERPALERMAANLDISARVLFIGNLAKPERLLKRFDVFALTSDTEQMPNSILEAMAAGLPVVATDVGDVRRMLAKQNAEFVAAMQAEAALADRMLRLLQDPALRAAVGSANRERVHREYALESMVERYDALFAGTL
jgi:glycosyltransferase involved in cell wall biosynthesis